MPLAEHGNARVNNGARQLKIRCCHCFRSAAAAATTTPVLPLLLPLLMQRQQRQQHKHSCLARPLQLYPRGERQSPLRPLLPSQLLSASLSFVVPMSLILPCPGPLALAAHDALALATLSLATLALALAALSLTRPLALASLAALAALAAPAALVALAALTALATLAALAAALVRPCPCALICPRPRLPLPLLLLLPSMKTAAAIDSQLCNSSNGSRGWLR